MTRITTLFFLILATFTSAQASVSDAELEAFAREAARAGDQAFRQNPPNDGVTQSSRAYADGKSVIYEIVLAVRPDAPQQAIDLWKNAIRQEILPQTCSTLRETGDFYQAGLQFRYHYLSQSGQLLDELVIDRSVCDPEPAAQARPTQSGRNNYARCLIDRLEKVQNDQAARAAMRLCQSDHPGGLESVEQGVGRGIFGFDSGDECTLKRASSTNSRVAALHIRRACERLYDQNQGLFDDLIPQS